MSFSPSGADSALTVRSPLRVGLVGRSLAFHRYAAALALSPLLSLVGFVDADVRAARAAAKALSGRPPVFESLPALLEAVPDLDAVLLAVSLSERAPLISRAALAGKAVLCEQPFAATLEATDAVLKQVTEAGTLLLPVLPRRFDPYIQETWRRLAETESGLSQVRCLWGLPLAGSEDLEGDAGDGWNALMRHVACQSADLCRLWLGSVEAVSAAMTLPEEKALVVGRPLREEEAQATLLLTHTNGHATIQISRLRGVLTDERYALTGAAENLELVLGAGTAQPTGSVPALRRHRPGQRPERLLPDGPSDGQLPTLRMQNLLAHFADCVQNGVVPQVTAQDARDAQAVVQAATLAAQEGSKVSLPLRRKPVS